MRREKLIEFSLFSLFALTAALFSSCGGTQTSLVGTFPYQFQEAATFSNPYGCNTGYKEARTRDEYCAWLTDDRQNIDPRTGRVCAQELRKSTFELNCAGYTWTGN